MAERLNKEQLRVVLVLVEKELRAAQAIRDGSLVAMVVPGIVSEESRVNRDRRVFFAGMVKMARIALGEENIRGVADEVNGDRSFDLR